MATKWHQTFLTLLLLILLGLCFGRPTAVPSLPALPLQARIGQMLLVCFEGTQLPPNHPLMRDISQRHLGGVMLRSQPVNKRTRLGNIASPAQLQTLTHLLQSASPTTLLIAVDQEGGKVIRLKPQAGFPATTSFAQLGQWNNLTKTHQRSDEIAKTLHRYGVNFNFSPVVDLNSNPKNPVIGSLDRSFSPDPAIVTAHASQVIMAHRSYGVATCLKHFPGHGSSKDDSHHGFVDITETWEKSELQPFASLVKASLADAIMTGHVYNTRLDTKLPATLSQTVITGLLREELKYDGVVISDDLLMDAIRQHYSFAESIELAINAGVDILLICSSDDKLVGDTISLISDLVKKGRISEERIDQAYRRINRLKSNLGNRATMN